jgi:hypothetical protein
VSDTSAGHLCRGRAYYQLARVIASKELEEALAGLACADDPNVRRRARWMLDPLPRSS